MWFWHICVTGRIFDNFEIFARYPLLPEWLANLIGLYSFALESIPTWFGSIGFLQKIILSGVQGYGVTVTPYPTWPKF